MRELKIRGFDALQVPGRDVVVIVPHDESWSPFRLDGLIFHALFETPAEQELAEQEAAYLKGAGRPYGIAEDPEITVTEHELRAPFHPEVANRVQHLLNREVSRQLDTLADRKPIEEAGSPTGVPPDLAAAIAARTEPGGPSAALVRQADVPRILEEAKVEIKRQMKNTEQARREGKPARPARSYGRVCHKCGEQTGGPRSKRCEACGAKHRLGRE